MDRIDIRIDVPAVSAADLIRPRPAEASADVAKHVAATPGAAAGALCLGRRAAGLDECPLLDSAD